VSEDEIVAVWMLVPEGTEIGGIEVVRGPFALDGNRTLSAGRKYKVHFVSALVSPVKIGP